MDQEFGSRIPHLERYGSYDNWYCNGEIVSTLGSFTSAGKRFSEPESIIPEGNFSDVPPGGYDSHAHVKDLAIDGVDADVLYHSVGSSLFGITDTRLCRAIFQAYNNWLVKFCSSYPTQLKGIAMVLLEDDLQAGIA